MLDFPLYYQLTCLYNDYAAALDAEEWEKWPDFFLEECVYKVLPLSLSYDHRVIDGADAIRFLRFVVDAIEQPFTLALRG